MFFNSIKTHTYKLISQASATQNITRPRIILGLSGGPDSLFLLHVLKSLRDQGDIELIAAHLDHGWRTESGTDVAFCKSICVAHNIPFVSAQARNLDITIKPNGSQEEVGRKLRRFFLEQTLATHDAHFIALGHHQDDQQETFLMRLCRGTSLAGLHGMNEIEPPYLRPLLNTSKKDIVNYLDGNKHTYLIDSTNQSDNYLRNKIRKYAIPALEQCDARFSKNFGTTVNMLKAEDEFLSRLTQKAFNEIFENDSAVAGLWPDRPVSGKLIGNLAQLQNLDPVLQRRVILHWLINQQITFSVSSGFINEIMRFLASPQGGIHALGSHCSLHKKQQRVWLERTIVL